MGVGRVVDHVDVLVAEFTDDTMHTATLHTNAGTYGIDTLVVTLNSHLRTVTRHTGHLLDGDQTVVDLGHLSLQQTLQEDRTGT